MTTATCDLSNIATMFLMKHNCFADKYAVAKITAMEATTLTYHMFEDSVNTLMLWLNDTTFFHSRLSLIYDWYASGEKSRVSDEQGLDMTAEEWTANVRSARMSDDYYVTVYDPIWLRITQMIEQHIPGETYTMWTVGRAGDFAILISGDDYRLVQWHSLISTKKIAAPSRKRQWRTVRNG